MLMTDSGNTTPGATTRRSRWVWVATALAVALALVLILAIVPLDHVQATSVGWFELKFTDQYLPGNNYSLGYQIPPGTFCTPADATGPGMVSFSWRTLSGDALISFAAGQTPVTLGPEVFWVYEENNSALGGYSISTSPPFECGYVLFLAIDSAAEQTVQVTGTFSYNYTTEEPIL